MVFRPSSTRLCLWNVLWSGGLTMMSDGHQSTFPRRQQEGKELQSPLQDSYPEGKALEGGGRCLCGQWQPRAFPVYWQRVMGEIRSSPSSASALQS